MDWLNLTNKTYVVTGGSSGIGAAIVNELINNGAQVVNADLKEGELKADKLTFIQTDVTSHEQIKALIQTVTTEFGQIDGLVNNAGINLPRLLVDAQHPEGQYELGETEFNKMFAVNVKSMYLMSQAVGHELVKNHAGVIVNMSSEAGLEGSQGQSAYSATKGAINGFTRSWAKELGSSNVRVVGVAPGIMEATGLRTPSYEEALAYTRNISVDTLRAGYKSTSTTPMGRSGKLSEVADLVSYLLSDRASYITGVTINVAGGKSRG
ncbi:SDR family oxidoreductase [Lactiplantibacillus mudanjiangensis]|uniref:Sorbitol-6-phosphate 2-dehydrogenase [Lactobacillus backii] n=1 Tax=Lactiplantibacillus mudanjiangensis TaxID=1296538 RepID=A0A660DZB5_9LACO|nr:SDR family oxidoreductase [Lactiplantibacillus mudanjiangensis]VDG20863.1 sorbitol-6-phosphate 2-dehydrogenase [Lactobacillus backii] [Lactiplantibacillus mudanjiangensis]VDG22593.1 sorbitol-6-phosphate 2-dehydrogenase [Lactobacillus backii] [Lactiplantibacillus mudanjiangensis]VDG26869.1 sorbitol-6-phosphate 2-dehydrogenase [Lactobacillus backii] [Lactiplantibacillus mudanjiangensis]VDG32008.1 sorbitol-6-phosphate 2-dehydrogenase [Lactobacillus backii] [Lactiplantibacillus mudanjiangensis]